MNMQHPTANISQDQRRLSLLFQAVAAGAPGLVRAGKIGG
jgi:hypothetical protein